MVEVLLWLAAAAAFSAFAGVLVADGAYEVVTGRPGFLPFERIVRHRVPAAAVDCVRHGAGRILMTFGLILAFIPSQAVSVIGLTMASVGPPSPARRVVELALITGGFISGVALMICSLVVLARVTYVDSRASRSQVTDSAARSA